MGLKTNDSSSIMREYDYTPSLVIKNNGPDIINTFLSLDIHAAESFLLMDGEETLHVKTAADFLKKLSCNEDDQIKVVSIFGNTGDGKSHTMNNTFFNGRDVFITSSEQSSCTMGVWAAYQKEMGLICLDTEGLLGDTSNENQRTRMLLKVLAISDIVIYRTRSERLHSDMFTFLGTASKAFKDHFSTALKSFDLPETTQSMGPTLIIFHETRNTKVLEGSPEETLLDRFRKLNMDAEPFGKLKYVGIETVTPPTNYDPLKQALESIKNEKIRSPRQPEYVYQAIKSLNLKFSGEIKHHPLNPFPEQYFTCGVHCESCNERCERSMGHISQEHHSNSKPCRYQHQYENKIYLCKACYLKGDKVEVKITTTSASDSSWMALAKYAWAGSVIDCPTCGEIYRSRQYWYGNKTAEQQSTVRSEIVHVWKGDRVNVKGSVYSAQLVLDHISSFSEAVANVGAQPSKTIASWVTDKIAPSYWKQNSELLYCHACRYHFDQHGLSRHHCRSCGEGFCNTCSKQEMPVPNRGWLTPVRVCDKCADDLRKASQDKPENGMVESNNSEPDISVDETNIRARKCGEVVFSTLSSMASVLEYPKDLIKHTARPSYWVPDAEAPNCYLCDLVFGIVDEVHAQQHASPSSSTALGIKKDLKRHHCRKCGKAVCNTCSLHRKHVPEHGWNSDVRICNSCNEIK